MKKQLLTIFFLAFAIAICAQEPTTFILVRHAEKAIDGTDNPPLSEAGLQRANDLAAMLADQKIDALYSTPFIRTEATLTPTGRDKGMEVRNYDPFAGASWLSEALEKHSGGTIVISGHSNTIPELANALLGETKFQQFDDNDYSNLIIIVTNKVGEGKLVRLKF